ncbi:hypothetical protein KP509_1Z155400 [Ceratopteris richardii]|nr:hypothetical protein KP509_1Z155400 [Ceratopteris richardii]
MGANIPYAPNEYHRTFVREVQSGDVVTLPKGTVYWWYNNRNDRLRVLFAGDTSLGVNPGRFHQFGLAGARETNFGSLLHGFSQGTLADAWGVEKERIRSLLDQQNDAGIVKCKQKITFPDIYEEARHQRRHQREEERGSRHGRRQREDEDVEETMNEIMYDEAFSASRDRPASSFYFEELKYSTRNEYPDVYVKNGGTFTQVSSQKLPSLRQVGFSVVKVSLDQNALEAPSFVRNANQLIYITQGGGRIQVTSGDGESVFDEDVQEGTVLVIPKFFPSLKLAGENGLEYVCLLSSHSPSIAYLAGRNSVYYGVPMRVLEAAFNVDEGELRELGRDEEVIFPRSSSAGLRRRGEREEEPYERRRRQEEEQRRGCRQGEREGRSHRGRDDDLEGQNEDQASERRQREQERQRRHEEEEDASQRRRREQERQRRHEKEEEQRHRGRDDDLEDQNENQGYERRGQEHERQRHEEEERQSHRGRDDDLEGQNENQASERRRREQEDERRRGHSRRGLPQWALF